MKKLITILLFLGLILTLAPAPLLAQEMACESDVVVQADDWLSKLAEKFYGDVLAFPAIAEATNAKAAADNSYASIDDVNVIEPGWKLCVPSAAEAEALLGDGGEAVAETAPAAAPAADGEKIELRIAWWGSQSRHDRTIKVIEMYEAQNPNIDIVYEFAGFDDYWTKLATEAAGGNLPDIMQQDYARIEEWVSRDLLMPLDSYVDNGALDFSNVNPNTLEGGVLDGKLYAVNLGNNSQSFVLDVDAFAKAGIELPPDNWTWADFERITMELHDKLGIWGMGPGMGSDEQIWKSLYLGHGGWSYSDDGTQLGYTDDQILIDHMNMVLRLQEAGAIPTREEEIARFVGQSVEAQPLVTGEAAMAYFWSNQIVAVQTAAGEERNFKMMHLPRPEGGAPSNYIKPSQFFSITSQAKHPDEAAKFINYFTNDVEANKILLAERGVPIASQVQEALKPLLGKSQLEMFDYVARVEKDGSPIRPPDPPGHADVISNVYTPEFVDPVLYGLIPPEEGVVTLREMASEVLAKQ
jgi:multiple sugar transport system substrate-binding protein